MAKLYIDNIFKYGNDSPSSVRIEMPYRSSNSSVQGIKLTGLMIGDPSFTTQNKWGTVVNDVANLQDLGSLMGSSSMFSWINASTMCWKGTSPLTMGIEFYLINYTRGLNLEEQLKILVQLSAIDRDMSADKNSSSRVTVHGGYAADVLKSNASYWTASVASASVFNSNSDIDSISSSLYSAGNAKGSLTVTFGHKSRIRNLLVSRITVTESNIEVADQNGGNIKPLFYRVSAQFTGVRPLITSDVEDMFSF